MLTFLREIWSEVREDVKVLLEELFFFIIFLLILFFGRLLLRSLDYPEQEKNLWLIIHFWSFTFLWVAYLLIAFLTVIVLRWNAFRKTTAPRTYGLDDIMEIAPALQKSIVEGAPEKIEQVIASAASVVDNILTIRDVIRRQFIESACVYPNGDLFVRDEIEVAAIQHKVFDQSHRITFSATSQHEELTFDRFETVRSNPGRVIKYEIQEQKHDYLGFIVRFDPPLGPGESVCYAFEYTHHGFSTMKHDAKDPFDGLVYYCAYPTEKLKISVVMPPGYEPSPFVEVTYMSNKDAGEEDKVRGALKQELTDKQEMAFTLECSQPKLGYTYALCWTKPNA